MEPGQLDIKGWAGLGVGFLGVALMLWPSGESPDTLGSLLLVISAAIWSFGTLYGRKHPLQAGHFSQVGVEMLTAGLLSLLIAPAGGGILRASLSLKSLLALGYLIVFGSLLAYSAYIHITKVWPLARAGTYAYWNPVVGILLGWGIRAEPIHGRMMPGLLLILLGVGLLQIPREWIGRSNPHRA